MTAIASFVFNPFQENTYILHDNSKECLIIDPGCYTAQEKEQLSAFIETHELKPVKLINTHCHVDHILGNKFVFDKYGLKPVMHRIEQQALQEAGNYSRLFGITIEPSPQPEEFLEESDTVTFGNCSLKVLFTPGHSPGEICLWCEKDNFLIAGDVLFQQSIGRTDLPGGDYDTLIKSIREKLWPLDDDTRVLSGHGPETSIGFERKNNPFLKGN